MSIHEKYNQWLINEHFDNGLIIEKMHISLARDVSSHEWKKEFLFIEHGIADGSIKCDSFSFGDSRKKVSPEAKKIINKCLFAG